MEKKWTDEETEMWVSELVRLQTLQEIDALPLNTEAVFVSHLDDTKIEALAKLKTLRRLIQDGNCFVTDKGMRVLGTMASLEEVDLEWGDDITDAGLVHLYGLSKLKWLDIGFCHSLTDQGIAKLQKNLPECEIIAERSLR
jgi:hypothetical protein